MGGMSDLCKLTSTVSKRQCVFTWPEINRDFPKFYPILPLTGHFIVICYSTMSCVSVVAHF